MLRDLLRDALRDALERKVAERWSELDAEFAGRRACLDLAISASKPSRKVTRQQAASFRAVVCGAIWTAARAKELGYDTDGNCTLCHGAPDTIRHRVYECPCTRDAVKSAVPLWFWNEAMRTGAHTPFWISCIFPHPGDVAPKPRTDLYCEVEHHTAESREAANDDNRTHIAGTVYVDGSCTPSPIRGLARAAGSLIMQGADGLTVKTLQMTVPRHLPQTSQAAEYLMMAAAYGCARGAAEFIGDCLNVVRKFTTSTVKALAPTGKYAGLVLSSYRDPAAKRTISVRWTRAHRTLVGDEPPEVVADVRGNAAADEAAKAAVTLHPSLGAEIEANIAYHTRRAPHVVAAVTAAMQVYPRALVGMARLPKPANATEARAAERHHWRFSAGTWRCELCDDYVTARAIPGYRRHQRCTGKGMADAAVAYAENGHAMVKAQADLPIVMCTRCGAWGNRRTRKLGRPCAPPTLAGQQALQRLLQGWHPLPQQNIRGTRAPRASARIVAAFDAAENRWVATDPAPVAPTEESTISPAECCDGISMLDATMSESFHEAPPSLLGDDPLDDEDVFGHGGDLDNTAAPFQHDPCGATPAALPPAAPAIVSRRRQRTEGDYSVRDYAAAAVDRLGSALVRRDTDPRGRMARLRRRILDKSVLIANSPIDVSAASGAAPADHAAHVLPTVPISDQPMADDGTAAPLALPRKRQWEPREPRRLEHGDHQAHDLPHDRRARARLEHPAHVRGGQRQRLPERLTVHPAAGVCGGEVGQPPNPHRDVPACDHGGGNPGAVGGSPLSPLSALGDIIEHDRSQGDSSKDDVQYTLSFASAQGAGGGNGGASAPVAALLSIRRRARSADAAIQSEATSPSPRRRRVADIAWAHDQVDAHGQVGRGACSSDGAQTGGTSAADASYDTRGALLARLRTHAQRHPVSCPALVHQGARQQRGATSIGSTAQQPRCPAVYSAAAMPVVAASGHATTRERACMRIGAIAYVDSSAVYSAAADARPAASVTSPADGAAASTRESPRTVLLHSPAVAGQVAAAVDLDSPPCPPMSKRRRLVGKQRPPHLASASPAQSYDSQRSQTTSMAASAMVPPPRPRRDGEPPT